MKNFIFFLSFLIVTVLIVTCSKEYSYEGGMSAAAGNSSIASGTLGGAPGTCTAAIAKGIYAKGIPLTSSNSLLVGVSVRTPGTYSITTSTVNGVSFSGSGIFTTTGVQNILLNGTGTPTNSGNQNFLITWASSACDFSINFAGTTTVSDYFPATINSNWAYSADNGTALDSVLISVISYSPSFAGNNYSSFTNNQVPVLNAQDTSYFRKSGGDYFQYLNLSNIFLFDDPIYDEYIFLKDNVPENTTWQTPVFSGTAAGFPGQATGYIQMTIIAKAVAASVGSLNFPEVIKMHYEYYRSLPHGSPFAIEERWYARGVGLVYDNINSTITSFQINSIARYKIY